ncbi:MAG: sugar ABC transporter substrate-binding protein [Mycobacteriales bacterium]
MSALVRRALPTALPMVAAVAALVLVSACASSDNDKTASPSSSGSSVSGTIALLLPETKTTRYEAADKPDFEAALKKLCSACTVDYANADQDSSKQLQQAEAALTKGAKVLVLDPVDGTTAGKIVTEAKAQNVPVISYDRLITGGGAAPDYYISFDNEKVGQLQGTALKEALGKQGKSGQLIWINGSPTDNNATLFAKGAHSVIPKGSTGISGVTIGYEVATPDWSPDKANQEAAGAISKIGKDKVVGVYSANDGMATGIVAALKAAGFSTLPPLTGQDAETAAITRILTGEQTMTVYKAIKPEAEAAAELAVALLKGEKPTTVQGVSLSTVKSGTTDVPSVLLTPVAVTKDNVKDTVIKDGYHTAAEVCTGAAAAVCTQLGIS